MIVVFVQLTGASKSTLLSKQWSNYNRNISIHVLVISIAYITVATSKIIALSINVSFSVIKNSFFIKR